MQENKKSQIDTKQAIQSESYCLMGLKMSNPQTLMKMETNHIMMLFFFIGGIHVLQKQKLLQEKGLRQKLIEYIISLQLKNGGFTCSTLYSKLQNQTQYGQGHIVFTYSALNNLKILGAIQKVDKNLILVEISKHQKDDGSFSSFQNSTQCDLRFVYSALSICKLMQNFQYINTKKAEQYVNKCYNFDGGFGLRPKDQSHCGAIYCAVASYQHLKIEIKKQKKLNMIHFLVNRQVKDQQNNQLIGVHGRLGKHPDSCYSFWVGASLQLLTGRNLLNPSIQNFVMNCYKNQQKSFSKYPQNKSGDPFHTFNSIIGLKILHENLDGFSLSQLLRLKNLQIQKNTINKFQNQ